MFVMNASFSVVIPTYRPNTQLRKAVASVLKQRHSAENVQVLICVNGPDRAYFSQLESELSSPGVEVYYTPTLGQSAGRNLGLDKACNELLIFLDCDDELEHGLLDVAATEFDDPNVNMLVVRMDDVSESGVRTDDTYYNRALRKCGSKATVDYLELSSLLATLCGKVYRKAFFQSAFARLDETLRDTEDVLFWAENFGALKGVVKLLDSRKTPAYLRHLSPISVSRPSKEREFSFYVDGRLLVIDRLWTIMTDIARSREHKYFIRHLALAQLAHIQSFYNRSDADVRVRIRQGLNQTNNPLINRSLFSNRSAIAFCHNFPPYVDASAYVAAKRLAEIDHLEGESLGWRVFAQDMSSIRTQDDDFKNLVVDFKVVSCDYARGDIGFQPAAQSSYVADAARWSKDWSADVVYSRSLFPGSHMAAYHYKMGHPEVTWYAEFSDPLAYGVDNQPRACTKNPSYFDVERMVYEKADYIIFTNANQLEYMMAYNPLKELESSIRSRARVLRHPVLDGRWRYVLHVPYRLDPQKINIAYFGTFYPNRNGSQLLALLANQSVSVHIFTTKPRDLDRHVQEYRGRLRVNATVGHLQMLNLASRMDYLFVGDTDFPGGLNPFVPSKLADYLATGSMIIARVNENSILARVDDPRVIKVPKITMGFALSLTQQIPRDKGYVVDEKGPLQIQTAEPPLLKRRARDVISRTIQCYRDEGLFYTFKRILALGRR